MTAVRAQDLLAQGLVDLVAFGRPFIANPDLPARLALGAELATFDGSTLFGGDARGYADYPAQAVAPVRYKSSTAGLMPSTPFRTAHPN